MNPTLQRMIKFMLKADNRFYRGEYAAEPLAISADSLSEIKAALDKAGVATGNEHETYSLAKRIELLAGQKDYFVEQTDKARAEAVARTPKISHGIQINNARAIAFHIRQGEPFAGLNMEALAAWVDAVADEMEALDNLWKKP